MTYWIYPNVETVMEYQLPHEVVSVDWLHAIVRAVPEGHGDIQRVYRNMGLVQVQRDSLVELSSPEEMELFDEDMLIAARELEETGIVAACVEAMGLVGLP